MPITSLPRMAPALATCSGRFDPWASQCERRHFAEDRAIGHGEGPKLLELVVSSYLCDACRFRSGTPQRRARQVQASQQMVSGWTHAQKFIAARSQRSLRHVDCRAKRMQAQARIGMCGQGVLKADHDISMMPPLFLIAAGLADCQAID